MDNGDSGQALLAEVSVYLGENSVISYYQEPLPADRDRRLAEMVAQLMALSTAARDRFQGQLSDKQRALFGIFAHRAATLAVREESRQWLLHGLVGAAVANYIIPPRRKVEMSLVVFHHCARKLDVNPVDLFSEAAVYAVEPFATQLRAFGRRGDVRLRSYGWREIKTPEGVRYKFEWN